MFMNQVIDNIRCIVTKRIAESYRNDIFEKSSIEKVSWKLVIEISYRISSNNKITDNPHSLNR